MTRTEIMATSPLITTSLDRATAIIRAWDPSIITRLDAWLDDYPISDTCRAECRMAMLGLIATDPEDWGCQSWTLVFDRAHCDRIQARYH
jgi:hypothetical protein